MMPIKHYIKKPIKHSIKMPIKHYIKMPIKHSMMMPIKHYINTDTYIILQMYKKNIAPTTPPQLKEFNPPHPPPTALREKKP